MVFVTKTLSAGAQVENAHTEYHYIQTGFYSI